MSSDFIDDLLQALKRVVTPDAAQMKDVLILSGMPEATENLRYLGFNRQAIKQENRALEFSAVAVINNRRASQWRLGGYREKISRIVFSTRITRNPMDLFINSLRCSGEMMDVLASSRARYTLLGILQVEEFQGTGLRKRKLRYIRPVVATAGIDDEKLKRVVTFEKANEIRKAGVIGLPIYCRIRA